MPKMKSHKAAQNRIGVTGSGKFDRVKAWRGHHLEIKSSRRTRRYAGKSTMDAAHAKLRRLFQNQIEVRLLEQGRAQPEVGHVLARAKLLSLAIASLKNSTDCATPVR